MLGTGTYKKVSILASPGLYASSFSAKEKQETYPLNLTVIMVPAVRFQDRF